MRAWPTRAMRAALGRLARLSPPLVVAFVAAVLAVGLLQWRHAEGRLRMRQSVVTTDEILRARLHVTRAYLVARNAHEGDRTFELGDAVAELDLASLAVADWLSGRDLPAPLAGHAEHDPELRRLVGEYARSIARFRARLLGARTSDVDVRAAFAALERRADLIGFRMSASVDATARREERDHAITVFLLTFFILTAGVLLHQVAERRDEARRAHAGSAARLRLLASQLPVLVWTTDRELRVDSIEGALHDLVPGGAEGALAVPLADRVAGHPHAERVLAAHRNALAGEHGRYDVEVEGRHLAVHVEPLRDDGAGIVGVVAVGIDVTERRRLEAELQLAQKMEAIGRLAGGVAHDFNNLLSIIVLNAQLLAESLDADDERRSEVVEIEAAGARGTRLVRQLLAVGRQQPQEPRMLDLARVVLDVAPMLRRLVGERVTLEVEAVPGTAWVRADLTQVEQILLNLATNARDAMRASGTLRVRVAPASREAVAAAHELAPGAYIALVVSDTGQGMDEATRSRLFDPFFTTKGEGHGTGLGLATVYGIVRQSHGAIQVESAPGRGATFTVLLRAASR